MNFIAKFGKTYASKNEITTRFEKFAKTYQMVKEHNNNPDATSTLEINVFADMEDSEMGLIEDYPIEELQSSYSDVLTHPKLTAFTDTDWRASGKVSTPKN